ncbi:MAG: diguanylate cyclase, partial [Crocosphaera sp.]
MTTEHRCPLCDSPLWPHVSDGKLGWFCRHCEQEVPYSVEENRHSRVVKNHPTSLSETPQVLTPSVSPTFTLHEILQTTVQGIAQFLQADRVLVAQMMPSGEMIVVEEWRQRPWKTLLHCHISQFFTFADVDAWQQGKVEAIADVQKNPEQTSNMMALDSLFDVKAKVIVPICQRDNQAQPSHPLSHSNHHPHPNTPQALWGLIIVHQCSGSRQWTTSELGFLSLLSTQLIISIQQDHFYQHLHQINQRLEEIAFQDRLTQIPNRHYFEHYFDKEWRRMAREKQPLSIILCDVDFFKAYNDTFGHPQGDRCLQEIAHSLKYSLHRPGDIVARYGGEEFIIILPNTNPSGAVHVAQQMSAAIKRLKLPSATQKVSEYVTISLGVAGVIPSQEMSAKDLLNEADQALYEAKKNGRDQVFFRGQKEGKTSTELKRRQTPSITIPLLDNLRPSDLLKSYVAYFLSRGISVSSPNQGILPFDGLVYQYQGYHQNFVNWWRQLEKRSDYKQLSLTGDSHQFDEFLDGDCQVKECAQCNLPLVTSTGKVYGLPGCSLCLKYDQGCQRKHTDDEIKIENTLRLLVITDIQENIKRLQQWLRQNDVEAVFIDDVKGINDYFLSQPFSAVIIDNCLDKKTIEKSVKQLHQYPSLGEVPVIALSEKAGNGIPWLERKLQLEDYVLTPFNGDKLVNYLRRLSTTDSSLNKT